MNMSHDYARLYHRGLCAHAKADRRRHRRDAGIALLVFLIYLGALCVCGVPW
jgi:hypothetical protein